MEIFRKKNELKNEWFLGKRIFFSKYFHWYTQEYGKFSSFLYNFWWSQIIFNTSQGNEPLFYGFHINDTMISKGTSKNTPFFNSCYYSDGLNLFDRYSENNTTIFSRKSPTKKNILFSLFYRRDHNHYPHPQKLCTTNKN